MRIEAEQKLDFDDVLIRPKRSVAPSRASIELRREYRFQTAPSGKVWAGIPIVAANFDTVGTMRMAAALARLQMLTCLHKFYPLKDLADFFTNNPASRSTFYTLGIREEDFDKFKAFLGTMGDWAELVSVDAANGYTKFFVDRVKQVRELCPGAIIMAGNVATPEMVQELLIEGRADIVKVGIGPGSVCTTRRMTGVGYPQLSAIIECRRCRSREPGAHPRRWWVQDARRRCQGVRSGSRLRHAGRDVGGIRRMRWRVGDCGR